jgi:HAD superfamily hydrolase (TIGR01549 family)
MIRGILFDCFGVLTETAWDRLMGGLSSQERQAVSDARKAFDRGFSSYQDFQEAVHGLAPSIDPKQLKETFLLRRGFHKNERLLKYIEGLHGRYKLGILSNAGTNWIRDELLADRELGLFDAIILSHDVGLIKPEAEFFLLACQKLELQPR